MRLVRTTYNADGILGTLTAEDGFPLAVTLEHSYNGLPKLPAGSYRCQRGLHTLHSQPVPFWTFEVAILVRAVILLTCVVAWVVRRPVELPRPEPEPGAEHELGPDQPVAEPVA